MSARPRLIDCPGCGRSAPIHARGCCAACYQRSRRHHAVCDVCGEYRLTYTGTCLRCQRRRRAAGGICAACGRQVARLWAGQRCSFCAHASWRVGGCADCCAWVASIADGRCRACRGFARRNSSGRCRSCQRDLAINRHGRCRLCTTARRDAHLAGDPDWTIEPGQRAGIQLFLGDRFAHLAMRPTRPRSDRADPRTDSPPVTGHVDGHLELFSARPEPHRADAAARAWAASPHGAELTAAVAAFAQARGWPTPTTNAVQRAVALLAVTSPGFDLGPAVLAELRRRYTPVGRLREFLTAAELAPARTEPTPGEIVDHDFGDLPAPVIKEMTAWVAALSGVIGRGRAHTPTTIDSYLRAVRPAVRGWAQQHSSLRQLTDDDITTVLEPLRGSCRTHTSVALRSLFGTLKAHRMIFGDPTRRTHPGKYPQRPVLGLDDATRAGLLARLDRADHRLVIVLAAVHALSRADITALRLDHVNLAARTLMVRGKPRPLDSLTHDQLIAWLRERQQRWPTTANPHLLITPHAALGLHPVSTGYFRALPIAVSQLRADRLLTQARDTGGDALTLMHLFGLSDDAAVRYCAELDLPEAEFALSDPITASPPKT